MVWTLTLSSAAIYKAGVNANSSVTVSSGILDQWSDEAEGEIVAQTRRDWVADYATLSAQLQGILSSVVSSKIAMRIINYDMSGYTSKREAETMLDVNDDIVFKGMKELRDFKSNTIKGT